MTMKQLSGGTKMAAYDNAKAQWDLDVSAWKAMKKIAEALYIAFNTRKPVKPIFGRLASGCKINCISDRLF